MKTIEIERSAARRYLVRRLLPPPGTGTDNHAAVLRRMQMVQMDPIDVCGHLHDLILRPRLPGYARGEWMEMLYGPRRSAFEYYAPNLSIIPLEHFRYFARTMRTHPERRPLAREYLEIAERLLERIREEGPLRARGSDNGSKRTTSGWGVPRSVASHVLERLWLSGRLCVARREGFERWYDLPERHLPTSVLALLDGGDDLPDPREEREFHLRSRFRALALFRPRRRDVEALGRDAFLEVRVVGGERPWYALREEEDRLEAARDPAASASGKGAATLLAPLDPLIYDRDRTLELFGFEYRWEVYTPVAKRRWGYYVLPLLLGDHLVARVDPYLNRATGGLEVRAVHYEDDPPAPEIGAALSAQLEGLASFLSATPPRA